jgi:magnesium transporter
MEQKAPQTTKIDRTAAPEKPAAGSMHTIEHGEIDWMHLELPDAEMVRRLAKLYPEFHPLNLYDVLSRVQRPKIDEYPDHAFIILHFPVFNKDSRIASGSELDVFLSERFLITIRCTEGLKPLTDFFKECLMSEEARTQAMGRGTGHLFYQVVDRLVNSCFPMLDEVLERVEKIEDHLYSVSQLHAIRELSFVRRDIIAFRRIVHPQIAVVENLERTPRPVFKGEQGNYFGDIADHVRRIWDSLEDAREVVEGLSDTINWVTSHRIQETMRVLAVVLTIVSALTLVAGFYGDEYPAAAGGEPAGKLGGLRSDARHHARRHNRTHPLLPDEAVVLMRIARERRGGRASG